MLRSVPTGTSRFGSGTVTRPFLTGCLNCSWLPLRATSLQPSASRSLITSRLCTVCIYTHVVIISSDRLAVASGILGAARARVGIEAIALVVRNAVLVSVLNQAGGYSIDSDEPSCDVDLWHGGL
jgi:hypothetical protein